MGSGSSVREQRQCQRRGGQRRRLGRRPPPGRRWTPWAGPGPGPAAPSPLLSALLALLMLLLGVLGLLAAPQPGWAEAVASSRGETLFANHCAGCHIHGGNIIRRGKTLKLVALERNGLEGAGAIAAIAAGGIGQMGGYAAVLGEGGAEAVGAWVWQQAQLGWPRS